LAAELRWILLALSLPLLAGIWWWTARRAGQTPGNAELRESMPPRESIPPRESSMPPRESSMPAREPMPPFEPRYADSGDEEMGPEDGEMRPEPEPEPRDWGVPPFEPLNIHTAEFDRVPALDGPMMIDADPAPAPGPAAGTVSGPVPAISSAVPQPSIRAPSDAAIPAAELQRIVTIRVCAVGEARWSGTQLMAALELHGLAFGRYQVFHRKHVDGRSLFCVASLIEPGTFDVAQMPEEEFRGITLFAVLPGPIQPLETIDELLGTARGLAEELSGMVQDGRGMPLSPQRAAAMREDIAHFQASLPGH
jgi:cell division protein ZipA